MRRRTLTTAVAISLILVLGTMYCLSDPGDPVLVGADDPLAETVGDGADPSPLTGAPPEPTRNDPGNADTAETPISADPAPPASPEFLIEGRVLDDDGIPILGARVTIFPYRRTLFTDEALRLISELQAPESPPLVSVSTGGGGYFRAPLATPGEFIVEASSPGFSTSVEAPLRVTRQEPVVFILFSLGAGATISGTLSDSRGQPLVGESLFLLERLDSGARSYRTHRTSSVMNGYFEFGGLEAKRYGLLVQPDRAPGRLVTNLMPPLEGLEVRIRAERALFGRVVDSVSGDPIPGVQITGVNREAYDQTLTSPDGSFELLLSGIDADLMLNHPDYLMHLARRQRLVEPEQEPLVFELSAGMVLSGRLVDDRNAPVSNATVGVQQQGWLFDDIRATRTDAQGNFSLGPVDPAKNVTVLARLPGWTLPVSASTSPKRAGGDRRLDPTRSIVGVVRDGRGRTVEAAWVRLIPGGQDSRVRALRWLRNDQETWTGPDGSFSIDDVVPAPGYILAIAHPDMADQRVVLETFLEEPLEITLAAGGSLTGQLILPGSENPQDPSANVSYTALLLILETPGAPPVTRRSSGHLVGGHRMIAREDGTFGFDQLAPGPLTIHVQGPSFLEQRVMVEIREGETTGVEISLRRGHRVRVTAVNSSGTPKPGLSLGLVGPSRGGRVRVRNWLGQTDAAGVCVFDRVPPGRYQVFGPQGAQATVTVPDGLSEQQIETTLRVR